MDDLVKKFGLDSGFWKDKKIKKIDEYFNSFPINSIREGQEIAEFFHRLSIDYRVHRAYEHHLFILSLKAIQLGLEAHLRDMRNSRYQYQAPRRVVRHIDYFSVLGLPDSATGAQVKAAYRRLVMIHHPDRGGSEEKFKEITTAKEECLRRVTR